MATLSKADSRRLYSWWWNSHISPKNSKWLQENLTDMDGKVRSMIKLIEEDADSFARRAEMYYKKRPELMKLVEEFYRAYRALAERYDHATGTLRQAHRTMAEAFPNQVPSLPDDSHANSVCDGDPQTPEMGTPGRPLFDFDELQKDALEQSSREESEVGQKGLKRLDELVGSKGMVRKSLNFEESEKGNKGNSEWMVMTDKEILLLKEALAKLENEKEAGLKQYQESSERLTKLESDISHAQQGSRELTDRASKAEAEAQNLKDNLRKLEAEKEESLKLYHQCLEKISNLEKALSDAQENVEELNEQAKIGENLVQNLKRDIARLEGEKNAAHDQYERSLKMIADLEKKLRDAEEEASEFSEHAEKAESEVESLKQVIAKLTEEKEAQALLYQECLATILNLELRLSCTQEEAERLNREIDNGVAKLKGAEERRLMLESSNQSLNMELESMAMKMGTRTQELTEKQKELGRLWSCIQDERLRFVEAETAFKKLQHFHSQAQEELKSLALEVQNRSQILRDMETRNQNLEAEIHKHKEENKNLSELNSSSVISIEVMKTEISSLKESKGKLEEEVELRVNQRNALQQEMCCLREELNDLNNNHQALLEQVAYVGLNPECFGLSVKKLQDENSDLKEEYRRERSEKIALLKKLEIMDQLLEKNAVLEKSLSDLGAELEGVRGKIKALEESYYLLEDKSTLAGEKGNLLGQLQVTNENLSKLSEKNTVLEKSLFDAHIELEVLKQKSKNLEDSCQLLADEKSALISEKGTLESQMETTEKILKDLKLKYIDLEENYLAMENEKESTLCKLEELHVSLAVQIQDHVTFAQMNDKKLDSMRSHIKLLQEESHNRSKEIDEGLHRASGSEIEIFILLRCIQDLEENNIALSNECRKLHEAFKLSERLIHELKQEKNENHEKIKSLADQNNTLRMGMHQLLKVAGMALNPGCGDERDLTYFDSIRRKFESTNNALAEIEEKNKELVVEMSVLVTLLRQMKTEVADIEAEKYSILQELSVRAEKILELQSLFQNLLKTNEELRSKVSEGDRKEDILRTQLENLRGELSVVQGACRSLQVENSAVLEENRALAKNNLHMDDQIRILEEENCVILDEVLYQSNLSLILEKYLDEKYAEINGLGEDLQKLHGVNNTLVEKTSMAEKKLCEVQMETFHLKETLKKSEDELATVISARDQLNSELMHGKYLLNLKEREQVEAAQKLETLENEKSLLFKILAGLQKEHEEVKTTRDEQGKQILKLSEDNDHLSKEQMCLNAKSQLLELKMHQLCEEHERTKHREETLCSELQKGKDEAKLLETQASVVYRDFQISTFCQALFEEKIRELSEVCVSLEEQSTSKDMKIELLKEKASILECENGDLKAQLAGYGLALESLRDSILSMENHTSIKTNAQKLDSEESKDQNDVGSDALADLQDLQSKVRAIETAMVTIEKLQMHEKLDANSKLEAAMRQIEDLKYQRSHRVNDKPTSASEISETDAGIMPKDIMLDQAFECSSYGISDRELVKGEIWEIADHNSSINMNLDDPKKMNKQYTLENELNMVDKLEVSKRFKESREERNKRKVFERLNSDVQKLINLQITIDDLKKKVEITEKSRRGKAMVETETLKGQLVEAETATHKLFELNGKLVKHIEGDSDQSTMEMEESQSQSMRRKRVSEQAKRVSEKIGRLQLEVQKIQFVLLKMDDENEVKGKGRFLDTKRSVLLKDYLYSGGRTKATISSSKRKKSHFCACVEPSTKGD